MSRSVRKRVRVVCDQTAGGIVFQTRANRREPKPLFSVAGGKLELVDAVIRLPAGSGAELPESLLQMAGGTVALRRCSVVDAAQVRPNATLFQATQPNSHVFATDSLLSGPGVVFEGSENLMFAAHNVGIVAGESLTRGRPNALLSHATVRTGSDILDAGAVPSGRLWIEQSVLAPTRSVVTASDAAVLRSIDWYGFENVFATGTTTSRRGTTDGAPLTPKSWSALWPGGRIGRTRTMAVGPIGVGKALQELQPNDFKPSQPVGSITESGGRSIGVDVATLGPEVGETKPKANRPSMRPKTVLPF